MIKHLVLLKFKEDAKPEDIQSFIGKLSDLPNKVPQIQSMSHGKEAGITQGKFDYGMVAEFSSGEECLAYLDHPDHRALGGELMKIIAEATSMQFTD